MADRSVEERQSMRATLLRNNYEATGGSAGGFVEVNAAAREFPPADVDEAVTYLLSEKLIEVTGRGKRGRLVTLTHMGSEGDRGRSGEPGGFDASLSRLHH